MYTIICNLKKIPRILDAFDNKQPIRRRETMKKGKKSAPQVLIISGLHNVSADLPEIIRVKREE